MSSKGSAEKVYSIVVTLINGQTAACDRVTLKETPVYLAVTDLTDERQRRTRFPWTSVLSVDLWEVQR